jgi:multidrug efflux pump subunit AcrA (membrane-fusion protein)
MTDTQEDQAEVADANQDATEEASEETAQAEAEVADENADQTEVVAEGTETEMEADQTAAAATDEATTVTTTEGETATAETEMGETEQTSADTVARTPLAREGFAAAGAEDLTADRLEGAAVYDANDERVGEVGEILLSADGQVQQLVIDVGGFLGLGEKPVALEMASLDILRQSEGEEIRVYVSQTEEELEAMERYEAQ